MRVSTRSLTFSVSAGQFGAPRRTPSAKSKTATGSTQCNTPTRNWTATSKVRCWPLAVRCSNSAFKDRNVRQDCRMRLHPLLAQER